MPLPERKVFNYYKSAIYSITEHRIILLPFLTMAFFQLLVLELLYFYPRYPLNVFFEPLISKLWSPIYMHYPQNLMFMPKLFQDINLILYIFLGSFFVGSAIYMISAINQGQKISFGEAIKKTLPRYVHIIFAAAMIYACLWLGGQILELIQIRAEKIRSTSGKFFMLKNFIIQGKAWFFLIMNIFVTAFWAYLYPLIVIEKNNVFVAMVKNFKVLWRAFLFTFFVIFWVSLVAASLLILRTLPSIANNPEFSIILLALGVVVVAFADAVIYTALTTYYLAWKEARKEQK